MTNSMDTIKVKYSGSDEPVSIQEFMTKDPKKLNDQERKIREAIRTLYRANGKKPPLYKNFVNYDPKKPLTINCLSPKLRSTTMIAAYSVPENEIIFIRGKANLVESLAHELKHAEQHSQSEIRQIYDGDDNLAKAAVHLMDEAEAFYAGAMAFVETKQGDPGKNYFANLYQQFSQEYVDKRGYKNTQAIKQKMMEVWIKHVLSNEAIYSGLAEYLYKIELDFPPNISDVGLKSIPAHYGLTKNFMTILRDIPQHTRMLERAETIERIPTEISKLKGKDGNEEKQFIEKLLDWVIEMKTPKNTQALFDAIKDRNGNLPFSREIFDVRDSKSNPTPSDGQNLLLKKFETEYQCFIDMKWKFLTLNDAYMTSVLINLINPNYCKKVIPILMSLKDKDGKPIISQENIEKLPPNGRLTSVIKEAYQKSNTPHLTKTLSSKKCQPQNMPDPRIAKQPRE